jgi:hypothetical protein
VTSVVGGSIDEAEEKVEKGGEIDAGIYSTT